MGSVSRVGGLLTGVSGEFCAKTEARFDAGDPGREQGLLLQVGTLVRRQIGPPRPHSAPGRTVGGQELKDES